MRHERYKYSFLDFRADSKKVLPDDINVLIEDAVRPLGCDDLPGLLERIRLRRMYGKVMIFDNRGVELAEIKLQSGICSDFDIVENPEDPVLVKPFHAIFRRSEKNWVVSFQKKNDKENN